MQSGKEKLRSEGGTKETAGEEREVEEGELSPKMVSELQGEKANE